MSPLGDPHYPGRLVNQSSATTHDVDYGATRAKNCAAVNRDLVLGSRTLHRQQGAARRDQREAPPRQAIQWRDRTGGNPVAMPKAGDDRRVLHPARCHPHAVRQTQLSDDLVQKIRSTGQGVYQIDGEIGSGAGKWDARQTRA
jgi:hypothetical protein